jgi:hypothetical protein
MAGINAATMMAMMAMTTNSSTIVNADLFSRNSVAAIGHLPDIFKPSHVLERRLCGIYREAIENSELGTGRLEVSETRGERSDRILTSDTLSRQTNHQLAHPVLMTTDYRG